MENYTSIEQVLDKTENNLITKSNKSVFLFLILVISGIAMLIMSTRITAQPNSILPPLFITVGVALIIYGIIYYFTKKKTYKVVQSGKKIFFNEIMFNINDKNELLRILSDRDIKALDKMNKHDVNGLILRVASTKDGSVCYTQLLSYVPHQYVAISDVYKHTPEEAHIILKVMNKNR